MISECLSCQVRQVAVDLAQLVRRWARWQLNAHGGRSSLAVHVLILLDAEMVDEHLLLLARLEVEGAPELAVVGQLDSFGLLLAGLAHGRELVPDHRGVERAVVLGVVQVERVVAVERILAAAEGQEHALFQFAFATGMRPSEYLALEWSAIDMVRGTISVERVVVFGVQRDEMKSRSGRRTIEMRRGAYNALLAQQAITGAAGGRVFLNPITNKGWTGAGQLLHRWKDILDKAKARYRNQYQTRHTFASTLLSTGENLMYVAKQMGHADTRMIVTTYGKWLEQVGGALPDFFALVSPKEIAPLLSPARMQ